MMPGLTTSVVQAPMEIAVSPISAAREANRNSFIMGSVLRTGS
jgi:hypothetical protein